MTPEIPVTLVAHLGPWGERMRMDAPGALWIAWARHSAHGLLGIYVLPKPTAPRAVLLERTWVRIQGLLRPLRVAARVDADPRSEANVAHIPLLIHATSVIVCDRALPPIAPPARHIQVGPGRWIDGGYLAPARHLADVAVFTLTAPVRQTVLAWNRPYGVIAQVGARRYLRYVLIQ